MINSTQQIAIKKYLGKQYSPKIIAYLNKRKIFNALGNEFSPNSIQKIVKGANENIPVEKAIFKLIAKVKKEKENDLKNRKSIIKK